MPLYSFVAVVIASKADFMFCIFASFLLSAHMLTILDIILLSARQFSISSSELEVIWRF